MTEKHSNDEPNVGKARMWSEITTKANALCDAPITLKEVKDKWRNLTVKAKSTFTEYRKDANKTGGGLAPKKPTSSV